MAGCDKAKDLYEGACAIPICVCNATAGYTETGIDGAGQVRGASLAGLASLALTSLASAANLLAVRVVLLCARLLRRGQLCHHWPELCGQMGGKEGLFGDGCCR